MRINFKELPLYTGISKQKRVVCDARESFADVLYSHCNGIRSKSLALKIFNSDGEIDLTEEDVQLIVMASNSFCTPAFIDSLNELLQTTE